MTELSRELRSILDRVHRRGDSFAIEQDGDAIDALESVAGAAIWASLAAAIRNGPRPGAACASDLGEIQRNQPEVPAVEWRS